MNKKLFLNRILNSNGRKEILNGKKYLVVPSVVIVEGVMNSLLYTNKEMKRSATSWNGVPVIIGHPQELGKFISANSPKMSEKFIGRFYNAYFEQSDNMGSLKGEIWIDEEKLLSINEKAILDHFKSGKMMEISTGLEAVVENKQGIFNGKTYSAVVEIMYPDHLALLPSEKGACSLKDGCGAMRINEEKTSCCEDCKIKKMLQDKIEKQYSQSDELPIVNIVFNESFIYEYLGKTYAANYRKDKDDIEIEVISPCMELTKKLGEQGSIKTVTNKKKDEEKIQETVNIEEILEQNKKLWETNKELEKKLQVNENEKKELTKTIETGLLSNTEMETFHRLKANEDKRIEELRKNVIENFKSLTQSVVNTLSIEALEGLMKESQNDYALKSGSKVVANKEKEIPQPSVLLANRKKENK